MSKSKPLKRLNPLHDPAFLDQHVTHTGTYFPEERCTGRTTALALNYLSQAIMHPHEWVDIRDHHDTKMSHERLTHTVYDIARLLNLKHIVAQGSNCRIAFGDPDKHERPAPFSGENTVGRRDFKHGPYTAATERYQR